MLTDGEVDNTPQCVDYARFSYFFYPVSFCLLSSFLSFSLTIFKFKYIFIKCFCFCFCFFCSGKVRQIFLLTDGEVDNTPQCVDYVRQSANTTRVFTFGIGNQVKTNKKILKKKRVRESKEIKKQKKKKIF